MRIVLKTIIYVAVFLFQAFCITSFAEIDQVFEVSVKVGEPNIYLNGKSIPIDSSGSVPIISEGRVLLPVRGIVESFGGNVEWDSVFETCTLKLDGRVIKYILGMDFANVNSDNRGFDVNPMNVKGRIYMPLRFVAQYLYLDVSWNPSTLIVTLKRKGPPKGYKMILPVENSMVSEKVTYDFKSNPYCGNIHYKKKFGDKTIGGYIDEMGKKLVESNIMKLSWYLSKIVYMENGKSGILDYSGSMVIAPEFDKIELFNTYGICSKGGKYYLITKDMKLSQRSFNKITQLSDKYAVIERETISGYKYKFEPKGIINSEGVVVVEPKYVTIRPIGSSNYFVAKDIFKGDGIIDNNQNILVPFQDKKIGTYSFSNKWVFTDNLIMSYNGEEKIEGVNLGSMAGIGQGTTYSINTNPQIYKDIFILGDRNRKIILSDRGIIVDNIKEFLCGFRYFYIILDLNDRTLFYDKNFNLQNTLSSDYEMSYSGSDMLYYQIKKNNRYGLVDYKGNIVVPPQYDNIGTIKNSGEFSYLSGGEYKTTFVPGVIPVDKPLEQINNYSNRITNELIKQLMGDEEYKKYDYVSVIGDEVFIVRSKGNYGAFRITF